MTAEPACAVDYEAQVKRFKPEHGRAATNSNDLGASSTNGSLTPSTRRHRLLSRPRWPPKRLTSTKV